MAKVLQANHAVNVGGATMVEPGQPIPADADPDVVKALEEQGLIAEQPSKRSSKKEED